MKKGTHKQIKNSFLYLAIILLFFLPLHLSFNVDDLKRADMFENEICSYNGMTDPNSSNATYITCICQIEFTNDNSTLTQRMINGVPVQCSYEKKRRFIALFLAIFLPFGFDHLYLSNYLFFALIFLSCSAILLGNCFRFAVSSHSSNSHYFNNKINLLLFFCAIFMVFFWVLNVILIWSGIFKDGNGVETIDDLNFMINLNY